MTFRGPTSQNAADELQTSAPAGRLRVLVLVSDLMDSPGGATALALWTAQAFTAGCDVTLFVYCDDLDFHALNRFYGTALDRGRVNVVAYRKRRPRSRRKRLRQTYVARMARHLRRSSRLWDLYVSNTNEVSLPSPHLLIINFPQHSFAAMARHAAGWGLALRQVNEIFYRAVGGFSPSRLAQSHIISISEWTRNLVGEVYGLPSEVIYPPVPVVVPAQRPWKDRAPAMVVIGRCHPQKGLLEAVNAADAIHLLCPDFRLLLVGFGSGPFRDQVASKAAARPYVEFHQNVSRTEMLELIARCRYGANFAPGEHFGIAPAEMAICGCTVLVHDSGGQVEIVNYDERLRFADTEQMVAKLLYLLQHEDEAAAIARSNAELAPERFGLARYQRQLMAAARTADAAAERGRRP